MSRITPRTRHWARKALLGGLFLPAALAGAGCQSATGTGALAGGGIGAATGAILSHGRAGGTLAGAVIFPSSVSLTCSAADPEHRATRPAARPAASPAARHPLRYEDIVQLTQSGSSDAVIIDQSRVTGSVYNPTAQDILYLQQNGVREPVIREVQATAYRTPSAVYVAEPPPPPVAVGVGVGFGRRW